MQLKTQNLKLKTTLVLVICFLVLFDSLAYCKVKTDAVAAPRKLTKKPAGPGVPGLLKKPVPQRPIPEKPAINRSQRNGTSFLEVEVRIDKQWTLEYLTGLPSAPESKPKMLDKPLRVILQLPAKQFEALVKNGANVRTLRKFVLVEGTKPNPKKDVNPDSIGVSSLATSDCYDENEDMVYIPDCSGDWVYSVIPISCAPAGATVSSIDVHFEIYHSYPRDLVVDLTDEDGDYGCPIRLYDQEYSSSYFIERDFFGLTVCNGRPVNQWWYLWAIDVACEDDGYITYWWIKVYYEGGGCTPPVHNDCGNAIAVSVGVPYAGTTICATGTDVTSCGYNDTADVWHSFTPATSGQYKVSLCGSAFDTTLAVFNECWVNELACNDDSDTCDLQSELEVTLNAGQTYLIRVSGYDGETGNYQLTVTAAVCPPPDAPFGPAPAAGATNVPLDTNLSWNDYGNQITAAAKSPGNDFGSRVTPKIIYGVDDRKDQYQVTNPAILAAGNATVAIFCKSQLYNNGNGTYSLPTETFAEWYLSAYGVPLCSDEPFRNQPNPAFCSGFLVAPDVIATAGHCPGNCSNISDLAFVFGFVMLNATTPVLTINESEIYYGAEVLDSVYSDTADWGLVRLDRPVTGHTPLPLRSSGIVANNQSLLTIGHPVGLPRKYAGNATVRDNNPALPFFQTNTDTYGGNSGSPVFNADNLQVEGILVRGNEDFVSAGSCDRSNVCPDSGCPGWEDVTRTTELPRFDVYFDVKCPPTALLASGVIVPPCSPRDPCTPDGSLRPGVTYYWQVVTKNSCGQTAGPNTPGQCWSFTTEAPPPHVVSWEIGATHGSAGVIWCPFNNGYVEPRTYGLRKLRFCFDTDMNTSVTNISQVISIMGVNGGLQPVAGSVVWESSTCMVITLSSALPDKDAYTLTLKNAIKSSLGVALEETSRCLTALKGDANANRNVNTQDLLAIRPYLNQPVNSSNAKYDINCNGTINTQDMLAARAFLGNIAPACP